MAHTKLGLNLIEALEEVLTMTKEDKHLGLPSHKELRKVEPEDPIRHMKQPKRLKPDHGTEGSRYNHAGKYRANTKRFPHKKGDQTCFFTSTYSERFDAYYCRLCDMWLEPRCGLECDICRGRRKPSLVEPSN